MERKNQKEVEPPRMKGTVEESRHVGNERERRRKREKKRGGEREGGGERQRKVRIERV